ncbi:MAG: 5'/3'-nucleotidase SurE [Sulfurospirillum sp.]
MKKILITNDDGFESDGLKALKEALLPLGHITVVAPSSEKSACGHSLTLTRPLRFITIEDDFFKLDDGTPSDCIYLSLNALFRDDSRPDLVVSGINQGSNMGEDITYSGTASAAMEAVLQGIPAIAISQVYDKSPGSLTKDSYKLAQFVIYDIVKKIFDEDFPLAKRKFLNINVPFTNEFKGYKITSAGYRVYGNDAHLHRNPRGEEYYWLGTHALRHKENPSKDCDLSAIEEGFVSISPIKLDMSAHEEMESLKNWINNG